MGYTKQIILARLEKASTQMNLFYKQGFINYSGKTTDTKEYYSEVIAEWLLEHLDLLYSIPTISRKSPYFVEAHDGIPPNEKSNREEELIAMAMFRQGEMNGIGKIIDYQTPLKSIRSDKAGKIDLLSYDGETLRILELKEPDSEETMLRCVLEGYTYLKTVDCRKLLVDFKLPADTKVVACPFVFFEREQHKEMLEGRPNLERLMQTLDTKAIYIKEKNGKYFTEE